MKPLMSKDKQTEENGECFMQMPEAIEFAEMVAAHQDAPAYEIYEAFLPQLPNNTSICVCWEQSLAKQLVSMDKQGAIDLEQWPLAQELVGLCEGNSQ